MNEPFLHPINNLTLEKLQRVLQTSKTSAPRLNPLHIDFPGKTPLETITYVLRILSHNFS